MQQVEMATPDALRIAGISTSNFRIAVDKGVYTSAPRPVRGRRVWNVDQMVVLAWFNALVIGGMTRSMAGNMADELSKALARDPTAAEFNVFVWEDPDGERGRLAIGRWAPDEAPNAQLILTMPLDQWRTKVRAAVDSFLQRKASRVRK